MGIFFQVDNSSSSSSCFWVDELDQYGSLVVVALLCVSSKDKKTVSFLIKQKSLVEQSPCLVLIEVSSFVVGFMVAYFERVVFYAKVVDFVVNLVLNAEASEDN